MAHRFWAAAGAFAASAAWAADVPVALLAERVARAQRVVLADVREQKTEVPDGNVRRMMTVTTVEIREHLKGSGPPKVTVLQAGGKSGLWEAHATGDATLVAGERVVLFLNCPDPAQPGKCTLSGLGEGKLPIDPAGRALLDVRAAAKVAAKDGGR